MHRAARESITRLTQINTVKVKLSPRMEQHLHAVKPPRRSLTHCRPNGLIRNLIITCAVYPAEKCPSVATTVRFTRLFSSNHHDPLAHYAHICLA